MQETSSVVYLSPAAIAEIDQVSDATVSITDQEAFTDVIRLARLRHMVDGLIAKKTTGWRNTMRSANNSGSREALYHNVSDTARAINTDKLTSHDAADLIWLRRKMLDNASRDAAKPHIVTNPFTIAYAPCTSDENGQYVVCSKMTVLQVHRAMVVNFNSVKALALIDFIVKSDLHVETSRERRSSNGTSNVGVGTHKLADSIVRVVGNNTVAINTLTTDIMESRQELMQWSGMFMIPDGELVHAIADLPLITTKGAGLLRSKKQLFKGHWYVVRTDSRQRQYIQTKAEGRVALNKVLTWQERNKNQK